MSAEQLQARIAKLAEKAPEKAEPETKPTPIPGTAPKGHIDIHFDDDFRFAGMFGADGEPTEVGVWFREEGERVLRLPWNPGGRLPATPPNAPGNARRGGPETSKAAADLQYPRSGERKAAVLAQFQKDYQDENRGITDEELAARMGLDRGQAGPRRLDLVNEGWVYDTGRKRQTTMGADSKVWSLTDAAIERLGMKRRQ